MSVYENYLRSLNRSLWRYARNGSLDQAWLDGGQRNEQRPPVLKASAASRNILIEPGSDEAERIAIEQSLAPAERHRWFRSMKSSQALAQSVFGTLIVKEKLDILNDWQSEQGLPALCPDLTMAKVVLENSVGNLGEPRPSSIDLWVQGEERVAVECKLAEAEFGCCSRPGLNAERDTTYERDHCDGSFTRQRGRQSRCSLTEVGIAYWKYIPALLRWPNDHDLDPCPLRYSYQLVRNILAACVPPNGQVSTRDAHVLVLYDARNPSFRQHGRAHREFSLVRNALFEPDLLRSATWQSLVAHMERSGEVRWLCQQLRLKFGF